MGPAEGSPAGVDEIWLDDVRCSGNETHFMQCTHSQWATHDCTHAEDVAISCAAVDSSSQYSSETIVDQCSNSSKNS